MIKKRITLVSLFLLLSLPAQAQPSILAQILAAQPSIVSVESQISGWYKTPRQGAVRNPQTGQIAVVQNIARASYDRYGAGVIVHSSGVIVTNAHNVKNATLVAVTFSDNTRVPARIVALVDNIDVALLQIHPPFPLQAIPIADSDQVALRDEIITVGNSTLLKQTVSGGRVTGLGTSHKLNQHGQKRTDLIQTSLNVYKGDSGGPLFNHRGQLIGLLTASETSADHSSFAIPSNQIRLHLEKYLQTQAPAKAKDTP